MMLYYRPFSSTVSARGAAGGEGDVTALLVSPTGAEDPVVPVTGTARDWGCFWS